MYKYRISKYNPKYRDENGSYTKDEWTQFSEIGKKINGKILTEKSYLKVEGSYIKILLSFLKENNIFELKITRLQNSKKTKLNEKIIKQNSVYQLKDLEKLFRLNLREEVWCKFKSKDGVSIDFGWDYYVYVGVRSESNKTKKLALKYNLFIEDLPDDFKY